MALREAAAWAWPVAVALALWQTPALGYESVDLTGDDWLLDNQYGNENVSQLATSVPGYALEALQDVDIIGDPLYRSGDSPSQDSL